MSTTQQQTIPSPPEGQDLATVPVKFEATPIPVTDFDRAKAFYQRLGWQLDIDHHFTEQIRGVQFTPVGSGSSIQFRPAGEDRLKGLLLVVEDIEAARHELVDRDVAVSEIFHALPGQTPEPGRDPEGRSYVSQAGFADPDGNEWVLQEVRERIPGRFRSRHARRRARWRPGLGAGATAVWRRPSAVEAALHGRREHRRSHFA